MIYIIYKISVLLKITWITLNIVFSNAFSRKFVRNLFRLQKEIDDINIKYITNLFRLKKEYEVIEDRVIRDVTNLFEHQEDHYKPVRVGNFWSKNYVEYGSKGERSKILSIKEYFNKIKPYLKDIINDLKKVWYVKNSINDNN